MCVARNICYCCAFPTVCAVQVLQSNYLDDIIFSNDPSAPTVPFWCHDMHVGVWCRFVKLEEEEERSEDSMLADLRAGKQVNMQGAAFAYLDQVTSGGAASAAGSPYSQTGQAHSQVGDSHELEQKEAKTRGWGVEVEPPCSIAGRPGAAGEHLGSAEQTPPEREARRKGEGEVLTMEINSEEQKLQAHLQVLNEQRANLFEIIGCEDRPDELTMLRAALAEINQQIAFVSSRLVCCLRGCHVHLGAPSGSC